MPRNKGDKDKKKRKLRSALVNSALLGVPTGLGLGTGKLASNYWRNTKGIKIYEKQNNKFRREMRNSKQLSKEYRDALAKELRSISKPIKQKIDPEFIRLRDQPIDNMWEALKRIHDPVYKENYDRLSDQKEFYRQAVREITNNNYESKQQYRTQVHQTRMRHNDILDKAITRYADDKTAKVYNPIKNKVIRTNLIKGGLIGLGVGSALLGVNALVNRNKRNKGK
jgi:hypothetical protein